MKKHQHFIDSWGEFSPTPRKKQRQVLRPLNNLEERIL